MSPTSRYSDDVLTAIVVAGGSSLVARADVRKARLLLTLPTAEQRFDAVGRAMRLSNRISGRFSDLLAMEIENVRSGRPEFRDVYGVDQPR